MPSGCCATRSCLFDADGYATAAALSILAIEESGKVSILRGLSMAPDEESRRQLWKDYRSHRSKNVTWILPELAAKGARTLDELRPATDKDAEHTVTLDNLKQLSLYTDYQVAVVPARPYKPKDKSKAEVAVQIVERWILARLRHHTFFSLAELNQCIRSLLDELNQKPFKQLPGNRRDAFEQLDKPALKALPPQPYRYVDIKPVKVNIDYHVQYQQHHYSVPHQYVGERLELHASDTLITLYFRAQSVATHARARRSRVRRMPQPSSGWHRRISSKMATGRNAGAAQRRCMRIAPRTLHV